MIEFVWIMSALLAGVCIAVIWRGSKAALNDSDSTSFLNSEPSFEHRHCDKGPHEIHWSKLYRTMSGRDVVILTTNKPGLFPVAGYLMDGGALMQWTKFGETQNFDPDFNLVEVGS